jgi:hypothetical protein
VGGACPIGAQERNIVGGELAAPAANNWGPTLCATPGLPPYNYSYTSEDVARQTVVSGVQGAPGMAVISRPINTALIDPANPPVYAPLTLSGVVIGFNIERNINITPTTPTGELALAAERTAHINLTPRLVAKLLTESYTSQFASRKPADDPKYAAWSKNNPADLTSDPEFLQYNPEFNYLFTSEKRNSSGLVVELTNSDASYQVWQWILADPEAQAWMAGAPDNFSGMKINPVFSTNAQINPSGAFGSPVPENFPKNDQYCYQPLDQTGQPLVLGGQPVSKLCATDFMPYANTLQSAASQTRAGNDAAKINANPQGAISAANYWYNTPQVQGKRAILSVTDSASAAQYGLQTASLSRAGDDTTSRSFVVPDQPGLQAGMQAMVASSVPDVLQPNPSTTSPGAYPITMLTYAAVMPGSVDNTARSDYASFIDYAVTKGQHPGTQFGDLPYGYAPLPQALVTQAQKATSAIRNYQPSAPASPGGSGTAAVSGTGGSGTGASGGLPSSNSQGTGAASSSTGTAAPTVTTPTTAAVAPPKLALLQPSQAKPAGTRTPKQGVGFIRYTLPIALLVGILAAVAARLLDQRRRGLELEASQPEPAS